MSVEQTRIFKLKCNYLALPFPFPSLALSSTSSPTPYSVSSSGLLSPLHGKHVYWCCRCLGHVQAAICWAIMGVVFVPVLETVSHQIFLILWFLQSSPSLSPSVPWAWVQEVCCGCFTESEKPRFIWVLHLNKFVVFYNGPSLLKKIYTLGWWEMKDILICGTKYLHYA